MTTLTNLTPHAVHLVTEAGTVEIPPSGQVARVAVERRVIGQVEIDSEPICAFCRHGKGRHWCHFYDDSVAYGCADCACNDFKAVEGLPPEDLCACGHAHNEHHREGKQIESCEAREARDFRCPCADYDPPDVLYIVSRVVAEACRDRDDLVVPDDTVRDDQGRITGCRALARIGSTPLDAARLAE